MEHVSKKINNGNNFGCAGKCRGACAVFRVCMRPDNLEGCILRRSHLLATYITEAASFQKATNDNNLHKQFVHFIIKQVHPPEDTGFKMRCACLSL